MFGDYLGDKDWNIKENANMQKSVNGLNNYVRETFTKKYWLHEVYPDDVRLAHESGDAHIHDLGFFGPYCAGWDLRQLLSDGFGGVENKVESKPARHLRSFLGQIVNSTFTTQGETAGAQAWSSFDTYCAPFVYYDNMTFEQVKQCLQEFVFNINVPTRVGFQCPFSNLTFDIKVPKTLKDEPVIIGGEYMDKTYGDFQEQMDLFNRAFCAVMLDGDAKGRVFTFPIPTINITKDFDWDSPVVDEFMRITCKYGIPYFANYVNSDLSPEDAVSMCCRLRLDTTELRKRGGRAVRLKPHDGQHRSLHNKPSSYRLSFRYQGRIFREAGEGGDSGQGFPGDKAQDYRAAVRAGTLSVFHLLSAPYQGAHRANTGPIILTPSAWWE